MTVRPPHPALAAALLTAAAMYGCGSTAPATSTGTTTGTGGATASSSSTASTSGTGGHGGAAAMVCPTTPPQNGDPCTGFAQGQQCNYGGGLDAGVVSATECQCASGAGEPTWSCGTEAAGTGSGSGSSSSSG